jgi:putative FmdB family regulatory protein
MQSPGPLALLNLRVRGLEFSYLLLKLWRFPMPHYEFFCLACKKTFSKILTVAEHEKEKIVCPHCGSKSVEQGWSTFSAITSKKSA